MRDLFKSHHMTRVKALTDAEAPGTFEALVSVFRNVDADGDVVMPGAFTKTLADGPKPIVYSHGWENVPIGQTLEARETADGLYVKGRLFVAPDEDHARAREVYAAMRGGALTEFSWGGKVTSETRKEAESGDVTFELNEVSLVEYGPCLKGANPATRLLAVKSLANAGILTRDEARAGFGLAKAESEAPAPPTKADGPTVVTPADDGWSSTLAAVRAGVLTIPEGRERLGLPVLPDGTSNAPVSAPDSAPAATASSPSVGSTSLARALAAVRLHA